MTAADQFARARRGVARVLRRGARLLDGAGDAPPDGVDGVTLAPPDPRAAPPPAAEVLDRYVSEAPAPENAVGIFAGEWSSRLPPPLDHLGGSAELFDDPRIRWLLEVVGNISGWDVLELGPLEAGHTAMLEWAGAGSVTAIEANTRAYLRCLIVKELLGLERSRFLCGDFVRFLSDSPRTYELCVASGVLYHMREPLDLLRGMAAVSDRIFLWTHYDDREAIAERADLAARLDQPELVTTQDGYAAELRTYHYLDALGWGGFCGGSAPTARWLQRDDILGYLTHLGFTDVRVAFDEPRHQNGPALALVALR